MKAKNFGPINIRTHESLRAESRRDATGFVAQWQSGLEASPGYGLCKLRLEFAPSAPSEFSPPAGACRRKSIIRF
jgi:hypothetical protein